MNTDRMAGSVQTTRGAAKQAVGGALGDTKLQVEGAAERAAGSVRDAAGEIRDAAGDAEESPESEVRQLRAEVDAISAEAAATEARVQGYVQQVDSAVNRRTDAVAGTVRHHPLIAVGGAALAGFLLARLTAGTTYVYRR